MLRDDRRDFAAKETAWLIKFIPHPVHARLLLVSKLLFYRPETDTGEASPTYVGGTLD
jgi:hypothetical protein